MNNKAFKETEYYLYNHKNLEALNNIADIKIKALKKDSDISEDEIKKGEDQVQKITDSYVKEIDNIISAKEKEIMSI